MADQSNNSGLREMTPVNSAAVLLTGTHLQRVAEVCKDLTDDKVVAAAWSCEAGRND
ncbi:hypothetical protein [uncultured Jatrophihabitans sp.]|uniref:hypothetical protein n=1 Tax=uncultured Jatrophihabitans sp. TaxID=1610747 RepID=UPI0035CBA687